VISLDDSWESVQSRLTIDRVLPRVTVSRQALRSALLAGVSCIPRGLMHAQHLQLLPESGIRLSQIGPFPDLAGSAGSCSKRRGWPLGRATPASPRTNTRLTRARYETGFEGPEELACLPRWLRRRPVGSSVSAWLHRTAHLAAGPRSYRSFASTSRAHSHYRITASPCFLPRLLTCRACNVVFCAACIPNPLTRSQATAEPRAP